MRISAYNAITQVYQTRKPSTAKAKKTSSHKDEFDISDAGRDYKDQKPDCPMVQHLFSGNERRL